MKGTRLGRSADGVKEDDEQRANWSQEEGSKPPEEAGSTFGLREPGIEEREGEPTHGVAADIGRN